MTLEAAPLELPALLRAKGYMVYDNAEDAGKATEWWFTWMVDGMSSPEVGATCNDPEQAWLDALRHYLANTAIVIDRWPQRRRATAEERELACKQLLPLVDHTLVLNDATAHDRMAGTWVQAWVLIPPRAHPAQPVIQPA